MATLGKKLTELPSAAVPGATDTIVYGVQGASDRQVKVNTHIAGLDVDKKLPAAVMPFAQAIFDLLKNSADAAALRNALGIGSAGTRSDNYFATAAQGGLAASAVQPSALATALAAYVTTATLSAALSGTISSGADAIARIEEVTDSVVLGEFLDHIMTGNTSIPTIATFQDWRDQEGDIKTLGISFWAPLLTRQAIPFGAAVSIDFGDAAGEDIDLGMCRSLYPAIAANDVTVSVASIKRATGLMVDRTIEVLWENVGGGTRSVSLGTGTGLTISHAAGVVSPGLGSTAGDWLKAWVWIKSTTEAVVLGYAAK